MLTTISQIIAGTPVWVWALFAFLLYRGLNATRTRQVKPLDVLKLPVIMFLVTLFMGHRPGFDLAGLVYAIGLGLGAVAGCAIARAITVQVHDRAAGLLTISGSYLSLALILIVFAKSYGFGVLSAMTPGLAQQSMIALPYAGLSGVVSGLFLGRGLTLYLKLQATLDHA